MKKGSGRQTMEWLTQIDGKILWWIQEYLRKESLTPFMIFITSLGDGGRIWVIASGLMLVSEKTRKAGITALCAMLLGTLVTNIWLKHAVARVRPFDEFSYLIPLIRKPHDFSFPSGHTTCSFAAAIAFSVNLPEKYAVFVLIPAALIGFSRMYLGVHYLSDVLAGIAVGLVCAVICQMTGNAFHKAIFSRL